MNPMERIRNYWFIRKGKFQFVEATNSKLPNASIYIGAFFIVQKGGWGYNGGSGNLKLFNS